MVTVTKQQEKSNSILEILEYCKANNLPARVVGKWIWIKFDNKPSAEVRDGLKSIGFRWSNRRNQWSHSCGHNTRPARNYRPWDKYQTESMTDVLNRLAVK